jgi:mannan endo-1,4-beta-mannosidase
VQVWISTPRHNSSRSHRLIRVLAAGLLFTPVVALTSTAGAHPVVSSKSTHDWAGCWRVPSDGVRPVNPCSTIAPTTIAPTTIAPTTIAPTTTAPTTTAPTTTAPTTTAPTTTAPTSASPTVLSSTTTASEAFITKSGSTLYDGNSVFYMAGANEPWLGLLSTTSYPSDTQIANGLATAKAMGANTVRAITLGTSVGCPACIEPSLGVFNQNAFNVIDYAVAQAKADGMHLIIPLTDNWHYYMGGKHTFTDWLGLSDEDDFFTNAAAIAAFETYISAILNHVNPYTGLALKDDPTVLAWETGNELATANGTWNDAWTDIISTFIKSIDPTHLVADGHTLNGAPTAAQLSLPNVDLYSDHMYPPNLAELTTDSEAVAAANKAYFIGEYDWHNTSPQASASFSVQSINDINTAVVHVTTPSDTYWSAQLAQGNLQLAPGTYQLSFTAQAPSSWPITVALQQNAPPYAPYETAPLTVSTTPQHYTADLTVPAQAGLSLLTMNLASTAGTLDISNLSLAAASSPDVNLLPDNSFTTNGSDWAFLVKPFGTSLQQFYSDISATNGVDGDFLWQLMGSSSNATAIGGGDQYAMSYPATANSLYASAESQVVAHLEARSGT